MSLGMTALVIGVGLVVAFLIGRTIWNDIAATRAEARQLEQAGYVACPDEAENLKRLIEPLRNHPRIEILQPFKLRAGDVTVYRYDVRMKSGDDIVVAEEFLFPIKRRSRAPFALFVLPVQLNEGVAKKILQTILEKTNKLVPPNTEQIEVPRSLRSKILTALGPPAAGLDDLVDDSLLSDLLHGASKGFIAIRAVDDYCTMEVISGYGRKALPNFDWRTAAAAVRELAER